MTQKCIDESNYYKLINGCSYSSVEHLQIKVKYNLQMFDCVHFESGKKINEVLTPQTTL